MTLSKPVRILLFITTPIWAIPFGIGLIAHCFWDMFNDFLDAFTHDQ